jgi:hypothetical protein
MSNTTATHKQVTHYDADGFIEGRTLLIPRSDDGATITGHSIISQEAVWENGFHTGMVTVLEIAPEGMLPLWNPLIPIAETFLTRGAC